MAFSLTQREGNMADRSRPYAIHSDSECDRLEKQAALAGLENHLRHVPVPETAHILDAGCGSGAMSRCFGSRYARASVIGVDIRDDYVSYAQSRAIEDGLRNVEFRQGSVFNLPFATASFDVVWSKYVMQWINEAERAVAEFRRVTKPGGVVVCCNFDGFAVTHYPEDEALRRQILTVCCARGQRPGAESRAESKMKRTGRLLLLLLPPSHAAFAGNQQVARRSRLGSPRIRRDSAPKTKESCCARLMGI
jgi:SAM-dependent methyltransferase